MPCPSPRLFVVASRLVHLACSRPLAWEAAPVSQRCKHACRYHLAWVGSPRSTRTHPFLDRDAVDGASICLLSAFSSCHRVQDASRVVPDGGPGARPPTHRGDAVPSEARTDT
ncbi:hypothetical protein B0H11DRAFT_2050982 [Mycena galericulata]|nr:hypothetical protein B0H11DRAFT_2050982 [Mycena galericulata]